MRRRAKGVVRQRGEENFDATVLATSFNHRDPGVRPDVMVEANDVFDVIAAVKRARRDGLKISICSGGHSWAQNHLREGGLLLDMSRLNSLEIDVPACRAIIGPGIEGSRLNDELMRRGLFFPIPHDLGVCMGGFLLQGGFGWNGRALGLGCENVLGIDAVLADGTLCHANETENSDLYWAARGAGPGFFAIVVRYHLRVHPRPRAIGMAMQTFRLRHLEEVFEWADEVGPDVPSSVEFQLVISRKAMGIFAPGVEVIAPVLAQSWREAREAVSFATRSRIKRKASIALPLLPVPINVAMKMGAKTHFPPNMRWGVDNMWTNTPMPQLLPGLRSIADTMPPAPAHALWINWRPKYKRPDMAFSVEGERYLSLFGEWRDPADDARYADWATDHMRAMSPYSVGIQLADENLARRPARFVSDSNLARLDDLRAKYDPDGLFRPWMGRPL